jgi:STE24 endopeptidase
VSALTLVALTPLSGWLASASARVASGFPARLAGAVELAIFVILLVAIWEIAALPATLYLAIGVDARYGRDAGRSPESIVLAELQTALTLVPAALVAAVIVRLSLAAAGGWWWLPAGLALSALIVLALRGAPALVARWSGATPIQRGELRASVSALARRAGVPVREVLQLPADFGRATALVTGIGPSRCVFVAADVARHWSDDEIAVVVAHEIGHHAHHDLWRTAALDGAVLCAGLGVAAIASIALSRVGLPHPSTLAGLPLIAMLTGIVWLASTPIRHAQSRRHERKADAFALALTGSAEAFDTAIRRLGASHLAEERPGLVTRWLFHRHPSVVERLEYARAYRGVRS